jgi:hypothetical protein
MPDDEVFGFVNDFERPVGTYLYGRRLYEDMIGCPVVVGGGKKCLPGGIRLPLELLAERRFANGAVYLRYATGL